MSRPGKGTDHVERLAQEPGECGRSERSLYAETSASGRAEVSRLRTEIALAFPHLIVPPRGGQKGGAPPKDVGRAST